MLDGIRDDLAQDQLPGEDVVRLKRKLPDKRRKIDPRGARGTRVA